MNGIIHWLAHIPINVPRWLLVAILGVATLAFAQDSSTDWEAPENLSSSGSATEPQILVAGAGVAHLIWRDTAVNSFVYSRGGPEGWGDPAAVELPFGSRRFFPDLRETDPTPLFSPAMVADTQGNIHAFWLDDEDILFYSRVPAEQFNEFSAWLAPQRLATSATGFSAAQDESGAVHISYVRTEPSVPLQAGVYYRKLANINESWSEPQLIYSSSYFQLLPEAQANTHLVTRSIADAVHVYLAWDNRPLEKLFFARSVDGGLSWAEPTVIDDRQPEDGPETVGPANIMVEVNDDSVLLIWQAGHDEDPCAQYYQISTDDGETWQAPALMLEESFGCPERIRFVGSTDDFDLYLFFSQGRPYLLAWHDHQWSEPQIQQDLSIFLSPETFRRITLDCHQLVLADQGQLLAIGCGTGQSEQTQDIWQLSRSVGDIETWFPPAPTWEDPETLITDGLSLLAPIMVADSQGRMHTLWSQVDETNRSRTAVNYAYWEDGQWSSSVAILNSPEGNIDQFEMTITEDDQLLVIWVSSSGKLFFSRSSSDEAILRSEWSTPVELPSPQLFIGGADIAVSDNGSIYVAYSVPINEARGVYLMESRDDGSSWSEPVLVLDGAIYDWEIVGRPQLEVTNDGQFHLLIFEEAPEAGGIATASAPLFYSRSGSLDEPFSQPSLVSEAPVDWADLIYDGQQLIHRLWQEHSGTFSNIRHEYSVDGGNNWSEPTRVTDQQGPLGVSTDSSGQLHAIQIGDEALNHRIWNGQQWISDDGIESQQFEAISIGEPQSVSVAVDSQQTLAALFTDRQLAAESLELLSNAYVTWRTIDGSTAISLPAPDATDAPSNSEALIDETATPQVDATATTVSTPIAGSQGETTPDDGSEPASPLDTDNTIVRMLIAVVPAALFLVIFAVIGMRIVRRTSR